MDKEGIGYETVLKAAQDKGYAEKNPEADVEGYDACTIDNILNERHLEFIGEGKRYFDLVRTGYASTYLVPDAYGYRTNSWTPQKKHIPLSQSELDADPSLVQNNY